MGCPPCRQKVPGWMVTFGDMNSLLLTFFIMLLAQAEINPIKVQQMMMSFETRFGAGFFDGGMTFSKGKLAELGMTIQSLPSTKEGSQLDKALQAAISILESEIKAKKVIVKEDERGLVISIVGDMFFEPGDAELLAETKKLLDKVTKLVLDLKYTGQDNKIEVEGFADSGQIPPTSPYFGKFPTNLDLASARSNNVIKYFWASGISPIRQYKGKSYAKFKSVSYGEFQPVEANVSPEERAYNRRVDIVFVREDKE
ncbi:MAG TPA: flagellar motor protein MotB [Spirochaetia bacterium]|nr:MAG: hypothetical protein A2Y41_10225 [Spirochaetes bacterium GWB1_36_13]HCL55540.1 flagellar motor protein MotB [Spirochaetia bacterium]